MTHQTGTAIPYLLDVTLRDGGYVNQHSWTPSDAVGIVETAAEARLPGVEVGYLRPRRQEVDGHTHPSASCPESYLHDLRTAAGRTSLVVMAHQKDVVSADYRKVAACGVTMIRLPTTTSSIDGLPRHVDAIHDAGMQASVNIIRVSQLTDHQIGRASAAAHSAGADMTYLADSNGSLFPERVVELVRIVREQTDRAVGFHAHDGLSLAFGNSLAALDAGCTYVDASLGGMGKGGGNLSLELIGGYLRSHRGAGLRIAPLAHRTAELLDRWRPGAHSISESIVSGLLDLNLDDIAKARDQDHRSLLTMLDQEPEQAHA
jgi:4-hydroxy 2-oxovalerate aldolase